MGETAYVEHTKTKSRKVEMEDMERVVQAAQVMYEMCSQPHGKHTGALALAHMQVCDTDPLRFFVTADGKIIINPVVTQAGKPSSRIIHPEGCMSFPDRPNAFVYRFRDLWVRYQEPVFNELRLKTVERKVVGLEAAMFQHEMDHMDGVSIYDHEV